MASHAQYRARRAAGLCPLCGASPQTGSVYCAQCYTLKKVLPRAPTPRLSRYARAKAQGTCTRCHQPNDQQPYVQCTHCYTPHPRPRIYAALSAEVRQAYHRTHTGERRWQAIQTRPPVEIACCGAWYDARQSCPTCGTRHLILPEVDDAA